MLGIMDGILVAPPRTDALGEPLYRFWNLNLCLDICTNANTKANAKRAGFNPSYRIPKGDPGEGQTGGGDTATQSLRQMQRETGEAGGCRVRPRSCHSA